MEKDNLNKTIGEIFKEQYVIPLYQRNFAWGKDEIEQLLQDIYENFNKNKLCNYYIGSLVVIGRADGIQEVIDGQQRLTVLTLLTKELGINSEPKLFYDSRPEVELFFDALYNNRDFNIIKDYSKISHLIDAVSFIKDSNLVDKEGITLTISNLEGKEKRDLIEYIKEKVILVKVEIPKDTDVASYFEIMNNRGEQLQKHEIVKSLMISKIADRDKQSRFATIWDACSQMDIPIQKLFNIELRKVLFGKGYDSYEGDSDNATNIRIKRHSSPSLEDILSPSFEERTLFSDYGINESEDKDTEDGLGQRAIIDFPNFIMHVLKLEYNKKYSDEDNIPLNEKHLLSVYSKLESQIDSMKFIDYLLYYRTIFDRFIVRLEDDAKQEDQFKWILVKPKKYDKSIKYNNNTFNDKLQPYIIKALSMLQVRFRTRIYKEWLNDILGWIAGNYGDDIAAVDSSLYLKFLHSQMLKYYDENFNNASNDQWEYKNAGTATPHFLFFFIDYLYWLAHQKEIKEISNIELVEEFDFKYWNSIEHHLPQSSEDIDRSIIDNLGNLCLVSKRANSRMNNENPQGKASKNAGSKYYKKGLPPKRKIMYDITNRETCWGENQIKLHYDDIQFLLSKRSEILGL